MANAKTAAEWKQAAANNQKTVDTLASRLNTLSRDTVKQAEAVKTAEQNYAAAAQARADLNNPYVTEPVNPYDKAAVAARNQAKIDAANKEAEAKAALTQAQDQLKTTQVETASTATQLNTAKDSVTYANKQAQKANTGAPDTNVNTAPANPDPGSNTNAAPTPNPDVTVPNAGTISGEDPFEKERLNALAKAEAEGPTEQDVINPDDSPEMQRLREANADVADASALDAPPIIVIDTDPERQRFLEANQADEGTIQSQRTPSIEEQRFLEANAESTTQEQIDAAENANEMQRITNRAITAKLENTRTQSTAQDQNNFLQQGDWRVRLSLAPESTYLYNDPKYAGILSPLKATNGVIFPYTPSIQVNYNAHYDGADPVHSNYKIYQYKNSSVENISIACDFTAQDTYEANYLLAVIHFFRTVTKMFYGKDQNPKAGTPPPLCFLTGLGAFQFDQHPLAITGFNYSLPTEVDYIRAGTTTTLAGVDKAPEQPKGNNQTTNGRLTGVQAGGLAPPPQFKNVVPGGTIEPTYVPTKIQLSISAIPVISRNVMSNIFSVKDYGSGTLLRGSLSSSEGIW